MGRIIDYIPPDFLANPPTERFVKVLDILHLDKSAQVDKFNRLFNHRLNTNLEYLRKFVVELTGWTLPQGMPKKILENILYNSEDLFEFKGTLRGLKLLFHVLTDGDVLIDLSKYLPSGDVIILNDDLFGYLPSDDDFELLANASPGFRYLFEEDLTSSLGSIEIKVISPYSHVKELRDFVETILLEFIPFADTTTTDISITYYNYTYLSNSGLNTYTYGN